ncbi:phospholipase/carboxylesterase [Aureimonas sp. SA4125]|uniref:alpha/beta hydrolase n=1 Tax=Aureimonas sp. SA4125 TaxID=2826993 RepID=UPI001CC76CB6|nr:alpha/beta hydrolase [Aureimonas sp. SA4125]BDA86782.1 phospholipase/carboxylesterase [Aureimonas sp. SA4125]
MISLDTYHHAGHVASPGAPLLFVFHGTGGDERQFFHLGRQMLPEAHLVSPRGDVAEMGAARFFRRKAEGRYDMEDLARATAKMAAFVAAKIEEHRPSRVLGLGYSNGANILATVLMDRPGLFDAAVLMHPLIPFKPAPRGRLDGTRVLITAGRQDPICPPALTEQLATLLSSEGADVETVWHPGGHEIRDSELDASSVFLAGAAIRSVGEAGTSEA